MKPSYLLQDILSFRVVLKTGDVQLGIQSFCKIANMYFLQKEERNQFWQQAPFLAKMRNRVVAHALE